MLAAERMIYIKKMLNERGIVSIKEIVKELNVSDATVRRDINKMKKNGILLKIKGGVASKDALDGDISENSVLDEENQEIETIELTMAQKLMLNREVKINVARYAANLVNDGECVYVDGGTSLAPLITMLANRKVTIVTNNLLEIWKIKDAHANIVILGGKYYPPYGMCIGPETLGNLKHFHFDRAFLGCSAVRFSTGCCYCAEIETPAIKQMAMSVADKSYLVFDSRKLSVGCFFRWAELKNFTEIICNTIPENEPELSYLPNNCVIVPDQKI
jgi:DeoR/GlpR family transcriptional regulator of sugar metabolism